MGDFRSNNRGGFESRSGGRDRGFNRERSEGFRGGRERRPREMHDVICAKCGKETQVPFKPTGDKPVYCRDCFDKLGSNKDFGNRNLQPIQSGISQDQFNNINNKLDKIIKILEELEIVEDSEEELEEPEEEIEDINPKKNAKKPKKRK